ncbi:MAG: hypothetical protein AB8H79_11350 [Myxococcota bacterium]
MVVLLLAQLSMAGRDPRVAQFDPIDVQTVVLDDGREALWVPWDDGTPVRLTCRTRITPEVFGISRGVMISGDLVSPGSLVGTWQIVPSTQETWSGWVVAQPDCSVSRRRTSSSPWGWALAEYRGEVEEAQAVLVTPEAREWAGDSALRWSALRPPGPHPVGLYSVKTKRTEVEVGDRSWQQMLRGDALDVRGPGRLRMDLRVIGDDASEACLVIDDVPHCLPSAPAQAIEVVDGRLALVPRIYADGRGIHGSRSFQVGLGPGVHRVRAFHDALVRGLVHRAEPWTGEKVTEPGVEVWTQPNRGQWESAWSIGGEGTWLMRPRGPVAAPEAAHWTPTGALTADSRPVKPDELAMWIEPHEPNGICRINLDSQSFATVGPTGVHRLRWVGPAEASFPQITTEGCEAWVHAEGPSGDGSRSLVYLQVLTDTQRYQARTDPERASRLEVSVPLTGVPVSVRAIGNDGTALSWSLAASINLPGRTDPDGGEWSDTIRLPLPSSSGWRVEVSAPAAVRVRQPEIESLPLDALADSPDWQDPATPPALVPVMTGGDEVRVLSRRLSLSLSDSERAAALIERAGLLAGMGATSEAARDLLRAEELDPNSDGLSGPLGMSIKQSHEWEVFGTDRWLPLDERWVGVSGAMVQEDRDRVRSAAKGDMLDVALKTRGPEAVRWWRRALLGGQIPDPRQRLESFFATERNPEHPLMDVLKLGSTWDSIHLVRGAGRRMVVPWPMQEDPTTPLLFPDAWPEDRAVPLRPGWLLRWPGRGVGESVNVRCLVQSLGTEGPCRILAEDLYGNPVAQVDISGWGVPEAIWLPRGAPLYLQVVAPRGALAQVLWDRRETPGTERWAWEAVPGRALSATILGPTALRVELRGRSDKPVKVEVRVGDEVVEQVVKGLGEVIVPIRAKGVVRPTVRVSGSSWVRMSTRRARRGGPMASADRRALLEEQAVDELPPLPALKATPVPEPLGGLPPGTPRYAVVAGVTVGSAEWTPAEARGPVGAPPALTLEAGVQSRLTGGLWGEVGVLGQQRFDGVTIGALQFGGDARLHDGRAKVYGLADVDVSVGPFADRTLLASRADLGVRIIHPLWAGGTLQTRVRIMGRVRSGLDAALSFPANRSLLWSRYAENHPAVLGLSTTVRHRAGPWVVGRFGIRALSNAPNDVHPVDLMGADASLDLARPRVWGRLGSGFEVRFRDDWRKDPFASLYLEARAAWMPWTSVRTGFRPWAGARWRPTDRKSAVMVGIQARLGPPRGLADVRPSLQPARHAGEYGYWDLANARWPVGQGLDQADPEQSLADPQGSEAIP